MAAKKKTTGINPDQFRLGPISMAVKKRAKPEQWRRIVKDAHAKGYTVESYLDRSVPNEYKSRTQTSLREQAKKTVASAYAPAQKELSDREKRITALQAKRKSDNEFYTDWLTRTRGAMQASSDAATQKMRDSAKAIYDDQITLHKSALQQAADRLTQQPGTVSSRDQLLQSVSDQPDMQRQLGLIANQRADIERSAGNASIRTATAEANVLAQQAAMQAAAASESFKALREVADDKDKLLLQMAGDTAEEVSRLLDKEISKAGANRDFNALTEKLDIQGETLDLKKVIANANILDDEADNARADEELAETKRRNSVLESIASSKLDLSGQRLKLDWYKARKAAYEKKSKGKGGPKYEDTAEGRYYRAYGGLASFRKANGDPLRPSEVAKNPVSWQNRLISEGLTPKMARKVVQAFINGRVGDRAGAPPAFKTGDPKPRT